MLGAHSFLCQPLIRFVGISIATVDKAMWGVGLMRVIGLEGCGEVNEVDKDRMWGLGFGGKYNAAKNDDTKCWQSNCAPRGGRTGGRAGKEGGRIREPRERGDGQNGEPNDQGVEANEGVDAVPDFSIIISQQF
ncbi:hypothetical protein Tco_0903993 [Tanacetum coccineum]